LGHLAKQFDGAWPYLELIASCNGISDPLDRRSSRRTGWATNWHVAYRDVAAASLDDRFARRTARNFEPLVSAAFTGESSNTAFTCSRSTRGSGCCAPARRCATPDPRSLSYQMGQVLNVDGDFVTVKSRSLKFEGSHLRLGTEGLEVVRRALGGVGFVATWLRATLYPCTGTGCATGCPTRHLVGSRTARE